MSLQITEISSKFSAYDNRVDKMIINNISKFDTAMKEDEELLKNKIDKFEAEASSSINKTVSALNSKNPPYYYNQSSDDIIKWPLLKSPDFHSHASQFTKHLSLMTLEGETLLQIQKWWDAIIFAFCQSLSTRKSWPPYKKLKS